MPWLVQRVEFFLRRVRRQHGDAARIRELGDAVQRAGIVEAVEARLHDHHARHAEPLEHGGKLADGRVDRRVAAVRGQREAALRADHVHMAVAGIRRREHVSGR